MTVLCFLLGACNADSGPLTRQIIIADRPPDAPPPPLWLLTEEGEVDYADGNGVRTALADPGAPVLHESFGGSVAGAYARYLDPFTKEATMFVSVEPTLTTRRVTAEAGITFGLIAPGGRRVIVDHDGGSALYDVDRGLLVPTEPVDRAAGAWSPDGTTLAARVRGDPTKLRLVQADGSQVEYPASGDAANVFWNHASTELAFGRQRLSILGSNGVQSIEPAPQHLVFEVKWAGDDRLLFYRTLAPAIGWGDGCLVRREQGRWLQSWCAQGPIESFAVSPDGRYVTFIRRTTGSMWMLDTRNLTDFRVPATVGTSLSEVHAASDRFLAFGTEGFAVFDRDGLVIDGLDGVRVTHGRMDGRGGWVAVHDGNAVRLVDERGRDDLYVLGEVRELTWSWDGQWVVVRHGGAVTAIEPETRRMHTYGSDRRWAAFSFAD